MSAADSTAVALSGSGGKDSALALWTVRRAVGLEPCALITTVTETYERISMHGVRRELLQRQAQALRLALVEVRDTRALAHEFIEAGFEATIVCLDPSKLDPFFAGRSFDERLLAELPAGVDPCGENGEFHTFVHAGPVFERPIACVTGETVERDGFVFSDLIPA